MDVQSEKLHIIEQLIQLQDVSVIQRVKDLLSGSDNVDFWEELSEEDQRTINESLHQLDSGEFVSHELIQKEFKSRFGLIC